MESKIKLYPHQEKALHQIRSGTILNGGVGSGKTLTSLYYYQENHRDKDLYVITTAKKRDTGDWQEEANRLGVKIKSVDSWNLIHNRADVEGAFFIFDEQRAIGYNKWGKTFIKIARKNKWIMLTATPGDTWMDYMTVFIANGFYKHKTDFVNQHVEYDTWVKFPKVKKYHNEGKLLRLRRQVLVPMDFKRSTIRKRQTIWSDYDTELYSKVLNNRWNVFEDRPIENVSELLQCLRKVVSMHEDRILNAKILIDIHDRVIVFYNYNYERDILYRIAEELGKEIREWSGHAHHDTPDSDNWMYIVQYTAGAEGWECITTNVMIFYSLNYSYKIVEQSEGRIDRLNTPYKELEYYYLEAKTGIDRDVAKAIAKKKIFNQSAWAKRRGYSDTRE